MSHGSKSFCKLEYFDNSQELCPKKVTSIWLNILCLLHDWKLFEWRVFLRNPLPLKTSTNAVVVLESKKDPKLKSDLT